MNKSSVKVYNKEVQDIRVALYYKSKVLVRRDPDIEDYNNDTRWTEFKNALRSYYSGTRAQELGAVAELHNGGIDGVDLRFLEYGLEYNYSEKTGILSNFTAEVIASTLSDDRGRLLSPKDLDNFTQHIVPTNSSSPVYDVIKYFGAFQAGPRNVYVFPVPEGVTKIALFSSDEVFERLRSHNDPDFYWSEEAVHPDIVISLGINDEFEWSDANKKYYPNGETYKRFYGNVSHPIVDNDNSWAEIDFNKHVFLTLDQNAMSSKDGIDVSYQAWLKLDDPLEKKKLTDLERCELESTIPSQTRERIPGVIFDELSGSVLGKSEVTSHPILSRKLSLIDETKFSQWKRYSSGDSAWFGTTQEGDKIWYESVSDNNYGNFPKLSPKWILKDSLTNYYTKWCFLKSDSGTFETKDGKRENALRLNIPKFLSESSAKFYPDPGYLPVDQATGSTYKIHVTENTDFSDDRFYVADITWTSWENIMPGTEIKMKTEPAPVTIYIKFPMPILDRSKSSWTFDYYKYGVAALNIQMKKNTSGDLYKYGETLSGSIISKNNPRLAAQVISNDSSSGNHDIITEFSGLSGGNWTWNDWWGIFSSMDFTATYTKRRGNKTWAGEVDLVETTSFGLNFPGESIDFEEATFTVVPKFKCWKVTIQNTGNIAVENAITEVPTGKAFNTSVVPYNNSVELDAVKVTVGGSTTSLTRRVSGAQYVWSAMVSGMSISIKEYSDKYDVSINSVKADIKIDLSTHEN